MKGPGIQKYNKAINEIKDKAKKEGKDFVDVSSKELHRKLSPKNATMPTCCQSMYKNLLKGDEILQRPSGKTGYGSHLTVRYHLNHTSKEPMFEQKRRGRPPKLENLEKLALKKAMMNKKQFDTLNEAVYHWVKQQGWDPVIVDEHIEAKKNDKSWIIDVKEPNKKKVKITTMVGNGLANIKDAKTRYSLAFKDNNMNLQEWEDISPTLRKKLKLSLIVSDKKGNLTEIK